MSNVIKGRLESLTFGRIVSKWIVIPNELLDAKVSDLEIYKNALEYVLEKSGYIRGKNELFQVEFK